MQHLGESPKSGDLANAGLLDIRWLASMAGLLVAGFVATVVVGKLTLVDAVKDVDEAVFNVVVDLLQAVPGLTAFSEVATDLGAIPVNYGMVIGAAAVVAVAARRLDLAVLMVVTLAGAHGFQYLTNVVVDGTTPEGARVIGAAGPFFSGGVMRVILITGMVVTVSRPSDERLVWRAAVVLGGLEALTRLALGRHWPLDLVAAFPIGLGLVWMFRAATARLGPVRFGA